jgi:hypothetical protein
MWVASRFCGGQKATVRASERDSALATVDPKATTAVQVLPIGGGVAEAPVYAGAYVDWNISAASNADIDNHRDVSPSA